MIDILLDFFDRSILVLGPILLLLGWVLVTVVGYIFFATPFLKFEENNQVSVLFLDSLGLWLWFNVMFNWILCFKTSPGSPPKEILEKDVQYDLCQKCDGCKPSRAHHCHVCQKCILAMDHHCPWMANCIGYYNYRYFVLTLVYLVVGCAFCVLVSIFQFDMINLFFRGEITTQVPRQVFFVFFLTLCAGTSVGLLLVWHIYLILSGQTTIEFYQRRMTDTRVISSRSRRRRRPWCWLLQANSALVSNDYDLGPSENWARVFGESSLPIKWALPSLKPPSGDGIRWRSCRSLVMV